MKDLSSLIMRLPQPSPQTTIFYRKYFPYNFDSWQLTDCQFRHIAINFAVYGAHLTFEVIADASSSEAFLNFPYRDMNYEVREAHQTARLAL